MAKLDIKFNYPDNPYYDYIASLKPINLDDERENDILHDNGFIVSPTHGIKKDLKDPDSIFSSKFGNNLSDMNQFNNRFRCECGKLRDKINLGIVCDKCQKPVKRVDDNIKYFGWLVIKSDDYFIIHPNLYRSIEFFIGKEFKDIVEWNKGLDEDGHVYDIIKTDQPYYGIGMIEFKNKFDEIMAHYLLKNPNKKNYYDNIMESKDKIFTQSIPVFSAILRPFNEEQKAFYYEDSNATYTKLNRLVTELNNDNASNSTNKKKKSRAQLLFDIQDSYMKLYDNIIKMSSGKKGIIRSLFAGRYNFSSRDVIVPEPNLRIDQVKLSYYALVELLQASIINIIKKTYTLNFHDSHRIWYKSTIEPDERVIRIIRSIIKHSCGGLGIPLIINRNPTIRYGSILQMFCVDISMNYTMGVPLPILDPLNGDFDGDVLNVLYIINKDFFYIANEIFNPRNSMYISRNDGMFDNSLNHKKDVLINANTLINIGRHNYTERDLEMIKQAQLYVPV